AVDVNPKGDGQIVESRTSVTKRFYANRNSLLFLLKNAQHVLLLMLLPHLVFLTLEALAALVLVRSWSFLRQAYWEALTDCWRLGRRVQAEGKGIKSFRRHGDFWMLRFLRPLPSRWHELKRALRFGAPIVDRR